MIKIPFDYLKRSSKRGSHTTNRKVCLCLTCIVKVLLTKCVRKGELRKVEVSEVIIHIILGPIFYFIIYLCIGLRFFFFVDTKLSVLK